MSDDLFERLRAVDPVTEDRIAQETRALGNTPERIVETEPSNVRRFPKAARRRATLVAVAAVVVVAIALPLTLLRPLGDGDRPGSGRPGDATGSGPAAWLSVGTLDDLHAEGGFVYVPKVHTFVFAPESGEPHAVYTVLTDDRGLREERALYCERTDQFLASRGEVFDGHGTRIAGNGTHDLGYRPIRVTDGGVVQIDTAEYNVPLGPKVEGPATESSGTCQMAAGLPLEGQPGFAVPAGAELPPIAVAMPQAGMRLSGPVTIAGSADVFEATVNIRVLDANGEVLTESYAMATCGTGCRGDFSTQVDVPVATQQPGTIQVFEYSAKDGAMINTVEVPVTLVPADTPVSLDVEGTWYDVDDQPLPDGSVDSAGTAMVVFGGADHCQWGSVSFMHLGWPIGTVASTFDDERQYVRDPESLFDDGALHVGYLSDTSLPSDATDTGYHRGPWRLWVSPSQADDAIFVVNADTGAVERWGRATPAILCQ